MQTLLGPGWKEGLPQHSPKSQDLTVIFNLTESNRVDTYINKFLDLNYFYSL